MARKKAEPAHPDAAEDKKLIKIELKRVGLLDSHGKPAEHCGSKGCGKTR